MPAPANPTAAPASATSITLTWQAVAGASHYDIERNGVVIASDVTGLSYTDTSATLSAEHDYRVRAVYATAAAFNPETDIAWHSLFWAEGTAMQALGYTNGAAVTTWPNETTAADLVSAFDAEFVSSGTGGKPMVRPKVAGSRLQTADWTAITQPWTIVLVGTYPSSMGAYKYLIDGGNYEQAIIYDGGSGPIVVGGGTAGMTYGTHLWLWRGNGASSVVIEDGLSVATATSANNLTGFTVFDGADAGQYDNFVSTGANISFVGIYEGDFTQDASYPDFLNWVGNHYALPVSAQFRGGTVTTPGDGYVYHTFTTSGTLTPIGDPVEVEYLVVAGGGGGGGNATGIRTGGGGGAGGARIGTATVASAQTVTVGGGGAVDTNGTATSIGAISSTGGGAGGGTGTGTDPGNAGGSGGGAQHGDATNAAGTSGEGSAGGYGYNSGSGPDHFGAGGGGGKTAVGANATSPVDGKAGDGGAGVEWPTGSGDYYAGGGGGGAQRGASQPTYANGVGGSGGGGTGGLADDSLVSSATTGTANTGGGGGGGANGKSSGSTSGQAGGSGIVIVRVLL